MAPLIRHGDSLIIEHGRERYRRGDILVFRQAGKLVAHRLVHRRQSKPHALLLTKGDNSRVLDNPLCLEQIQGKVIAVESSTGRLCFASGFWKIANFLLALGSYFSVRYRRPWSRLGNMVLPLRMLYAPRALGDVPLQHVLARILRTAYHLHYGPWKRNRRSMGDPADGY